MPTLDAYDAIRHVDEVQQENARIAMKEQALVFAGRRSAQFDAYGTQADQRFIECFYRFLNQPVSATSRLCPDTVSNVLDMRAALEVAVMETRSATRLDDCIAAENVLQNAYRVLTAMDSAVIAVDFGEQASLGDGAPSATQSKGPSA